MESLRSHVYSSTIIWMTKELAKIFFIRAQYFFFSEHLFVPGFKICNEVQLGFDIIFRFLFFFIFIMNLWSIQHENAYEIIYLEDILDQIKWVLPGSQ